MNAQKINRLGKTAWDTYRKTLGGVSGATGQPLPTWSQLCQDPSKAKIVEGWEKAALAVAVELGVAS